MENIALNQLTKKGKTMVGKAQREVESAVRGALGDESSDDERSKRETEPLMGRTSRAIEETPGFFADYIKPCYAELTGTTIFVFVGTLSAASGGGLLNVALAHGLTILLLVVMFGPVSGGHFNPAVTLGVALSGGMKPLLAPCYVVCQLVGAILGAALTRVKSIPLLLLNSIMCKLFANKGTLYKAVDGGATLCGKDTTAWQGFLIEAVLTFILVSAVLVAAVGYEHHLAPLAIGFALAVSIAAGGPVSGASLNPARSLGPAVVATGVVSGVWTKHWIYWAGPILGSLMALLDYRLVFASPQNRLVFKGNSRH